MVCGRCVYGILQLWQDSLIYASAHFSIHHVYWEVRGRCVYGIYNCGRVVIVQFMSVYSMCTGRIKGYAECGVEGMIS